jgi:hypothetical protein
MEQEKVKKTILLSHGTRISKEDHAFNPMEKQKVKKTTLFIPWNKNKKRILCFLSH